MGRVSSGLVLTAISALLAGIGGVVAADAFQEVDPLVVAQYRSVIAAAVLVPIAYRRRMTMTGGRLPLLGVFGLVIAGMIIAFYWSIQRLGVGPGVTLQFTATVPVLFWNRFVRELTVPPASWAAAALAIVGSAFVVRAWDVETLDVLGLLSALASMLGFATYLILGEHLGTRLPSLTVIAYGFAVSALFWVVVVPPRLVDVSATVWLQLGWIGVMATAVPFLLMTTALTRADSGSVGVVATLEPVFAAIVAWVFLGQELTVVQSFGGVLVVVSLIVIQRSISTRSIQTI